VWSTTTNTTGTTRSSPAGPARRGPLFIVFEGVEGSGKSTQIQLIAAALKELGADPVVTREPGGTAAGEAIRAVVLDRDLQLDAVAELMLMLAARSVFVREVVEPALAAGRIVLADRYELSTFAYQGGGRGLPLEKLRQLNDLATGGRRPDLSVVLDVEVEEGQARGRRSRRDRIEGEEIEFHYRVAEAYREMARPAPDVALVDGRLEIEKVFVAVWDALSARFPETFPPRKC
jgi:dTMP kinase